MANKESVAAVRFTDWEAAEKHGPGAFIIEEGEKRIDFFFIVPGENFLRVIEIVVGQPERQAWGWDGNLDCPTLTPSILAWDRTQGKGDKVEVWHGYLTAGQFKSC